MTTGPACTETPTRSESSAPNDGEGDRRLGETLRRARQYHGWSLRDVERQTGRPNAYLSQVERGIIRRPDPVVLWHLADLYSLNFDLLMQWAAYESSSGGDSPDSTTSALIKGIMSLTQRQRVALLAHLQGLAREDRS